MVKLFKHQKRFVEINLAPKKGWEFSVFITNFYPKLKSKNFVLFSISIVSFIGIFVEDYIADKLLAQEENKIKNLRKSLLYQNMKILRLKKNLQIAEQKFKNFYIPNLKEKIFYIWYYEYGLLKIWKAIDEYSKIVRGKTSIVGFRIFPSPYNSLSKSVTFEGFRKKSIIYKPIKDNLFIRGDNINNSFIIYVNPFEVDKQFAQNIAKIKDSTIKANLLLEYGLLMNKIKPEYIKIPIAILFPVNIFFESSKDFESTLTELKNFCGILQINNGLEEKIYTVTNKEKKGFIDGICIKYIY